MNGFRRIISAASMGPEGRARNLAVRRRRTGTIGALRRALPIRAALLPTAAVAVPALTPSEIVDHAPSGAWRNGPLGAVPRGTGARGFYVDKAQDVAIRGVSPVVDLSPAQQPHLQLMGTDAPAFAAYLKARANRTDPFYVRPAHGVSLCNVPVPVRTRSSAP